MKNGALIVVVECPLTLHFEMAPKKIFFTGLFKIIELFINMFKNFFYGLRRVDFKRFFFLTCQRVRAFWDLEKNVLHEIRVSGTVLQSPTTTKIPHLHVHKAKTVVHQLLG